MNICHRYLLLSLCIGAMFIQNSSCTKAADTAQSAAVTHPANNAGSSAIASPNCIDSVIGTYYGTYTRWGSEHINGVRHDFGYYGPDTFLVVKSGAIGVHVESNHIARSDYFEFDSSKTMYSYGSINYSPTEASLDFYPAKDSLKYNYRYEGPDDGTFCSFVGRK